MSLHLTPRQSFFAVGKPNRPMSDKLTRERLARIPPLCSARAQDCGYRGSAGRLRNLSHRPIIEILKVCLTLFAVECLPEKDLYVPFPENKYDSFFVIVHAPDVL